MVACQELISPGGKSLRPLPAPACGDRHRGERNATRHIAHGIDSRNIRFHFVIHRDNTPIGNEHAGILQSNDRGRAWQSLESNLAVSCVNAILFDRDAKGIFVAADAHYFRGRAAYHLYPHSVFFDPRSNELQWADQLRPGDWLLVYQQRGIQYDASRQMLRWETGRTTSAEVKLIEPGAALFRIR